MNKPGIPAPLRAADLYPTVEALRQNVEIVTGRRGTKISPLESTATLADVIDKVNEILAAMQ